MTEYQHNSKDKEFIRAQWINFAEEIRDDTTEFSMITLTTESLDDLKLFSEKGFFEISELNTGLLRIDKGKFKCFESNGATYRKLFKLLPNGVVVSGEIGHEIGKEYNKVFIESNEDKIFPCNVINLDFTGSISNVTKRGIVNVFKWIFEFQKKFKMSYSLFITFANTISSDETDILRQFEDIIKENVENIHTEFKSRFDDKYSSIDVLKNNSYDQFLATGISKFLVKLGSENKFTIDNFDFYYYSKERHKMISLLFNFKFIEDNTPQIETYKQDCIKCLTDIKEVLQNE